MPWSVGLFRRFRSLVLRSPVRITGQCALCGRCCQDILLQNKGVWLRKPEQYRDMIESLPGYDRFEPVGHDDFGHMTFSCNRLDTNNRCTDYAGRPSLCRNYPSESLYYRGGGLRHDCGFSFEAQTFRDVFLRRSGLKADFARILGRELHKEDNDRKKEEDIPL